MDESQQKRLNELLELKAKKEKADQDAASLRELEEEELSVALEEKLKGKRGEAFEVINSKFGVFGLRRPDTQAIRNWEKASDEKKQSIEWQLNLIRHYIEPTPEKGLEWARIIGDNRPGLLWQTVNAFLVLMGIDTGVLQKK